MYNRIISLAPSNTEILFSLEAQHKVVGITTLCDYPAEAQSLPKIGSWLKINDIKKLSKLKPDLILTSMYVNPLVKNWAKENKVKLVNLFPQTLEGIYDSIMKIAMLVGNVEKGRKIVAKIKKRLNSVKKVRKKVKIYSEEFHKPPTVAGNWVPELIEIVGGISMIKPGVLSREVTYDELAKFNPDVIVLHWCGFKDKSKPSLVKKRENWHKLRAVKENKIFIIDDTFLNRPGPRIWKGAFLLREIIENAI